MNKNHRFPIIMALISVIAILLAACGPAATPTAMPPTSVPPTAVPPTAVPPTTTAGPVTLIINGAVDNELQLTNADLQSMDAVTLNLVHPKNGPADYTGVRLNDLLNEAGLKSDATSVTLTASDGYSTDLDLATIQACMDCLVAFDAGNPGIYSSAMPDQSSKVWVKSLTTITVVAAGPVTLVVTGMVTNELQLSDSDLHAMDVVTLNLEHPKNGPADYTGVRLNDLLNQAGIEAGAATITLTASDGFSTDLDLATVQACANCLIAFDPANPGVYNAAMPEQSSKSWVNGVVSITMK